MVDGLARRVLAPVLRWARTHGRSGLAIIGALPGDGAEAWTTAAALPLALPIDAADPRQADVLVVVGRISHKLAPFLVRTHAAMARPASVLAVEFEAPDAPMHALYASVPRLADILPVDVIVRGRPPTPALLAHALAALERRPHEGRP